MNSDLSDVRFTFESRVVDLRNGEFRVITECRAYREGWRIMQAAVSTDSTSGVLSDYLRRVTEDHPKYNPRATAERILQVQRDLARQAVLKRVGINQI